MTDAPAQSPARFFLSQPHDCQYLPGLEATMIFADPQSPMDQALYTLLCANGFRRSGELVYRPHCRGCSRCVPVRVPAAAFRPRRSQRRAWRRNRDLRASVCALAYTPEDYRLFRRYLRGRHAGGDMDGFTPDQLSRFLSSSWSQTLACRFHRGDDLAAVAILDVLDHGLSAVYTFFDPRLVERSLGVFTLLWSIERTVRAGLPWLYLGYWIRETPKMSYKSEYLPQERFIDDAWRTVG